MLRLVFLAGLVLFCTAAKDDCAGETAAERAGKTCAKHRAKPEMTREQVGDLLIDCCNFSEASEQELCQESVLRVMSGEFL